MDAAILTRTPYANLVDHSPESFHEFGAGYFPGWLGIEILSIEPEQTVGRVEVRTELMAPHGYLHGRS